MKTVPSAVASTSAVAASALGLAFVQRQAQPVVSSHRDHEEKEHNQQRSVSAPFFDMTTTTTFTVSPLPTFSSSPGSFTFSSPSPITPNAARPNISRGGNSDLNTQSGRALDVGDGRRSLKRRLQARETTPASVVLTHPALDTDNTHGPSQVTNTTQSSWSKRLSTFSSYDGSFTSSPRPPSTAVSQSNGSVAFSNAGSTTPMFPSFPPASIPPNKLVKRASSIRSTKGSSRIPMPTFKRPATSHDRDATLQELQRRPSTADSSLPHELTPQLAPESGWKAYFKPTLFFDNSVSNGPRRSSTSIPNPIKRVQPDRKYHPVLVSASEQIQPVSIDYEEEARDDSLPAFPARRPSMSLRVGRRFFSSPLPQRPSTASSNTSASLSRFPRSAASQANSAENASNRNSMLSLHKGELPNSSPLMSTRSFSPIDLKPPPLPKWKRPTKSKPSEGKYRRKGTRTSSTPEHSSGTASINATPELERPAKRRDITGGYVSSRNGPVHSPTSPRDDLVGSRGGSPGLTKTLRAFSSNASTDLRSAYLEHGSMNPGSNALSSPAAGSTRGHPSRHSTALSEASTFAGSDSDARYNDDDGFESPNETFFDSVRTRATSAGSVGVRGPRLDAIFGDGVTLQADKTPPPPPLNLFHGSKFSKEAFERPRHSVIEEEESVSTPVRSTHHNSAQASPETFRFGSSPTRQLGSSPPDVPFLFRRQVSDQVGLGIDQDVEMWDFADEDKLPRWHIEGGQSPTVSGLQQPDSVLGDDFVDFTTTPSKAAWDQPSDAKNNIFDWSEQPLEKNAAGRSPPRPRTVHGKKDADVRGSRSVGRRAPSGLHVRSQSVPVVPDSDVKKAQVITNKFGTWGVGSKGVTEDWNDDFDFEEPVPTIPAEYQQGNESDTLTLPSRAIQSRDPSGSMRVPQAIQKQQKIVLANIELLRDWGLLIEELKELRLRATTIDPGLMKGNELWDQVEAMICLADQEANDHTLAPRLSPPSSPAFDMSGFDEAPAPPLFARNSPRSVPKLHAENIFESPASSPAKALVEKKEGISPRRPRKDSEAVARSVIEALQQRRNISDPTGASTDQTPKKVPFDTATLRRIVPFVHELRDNVKKAMRDAEDLYNSPNLDQGSSQSPPDDLSRRMELMTVG